MSKRITKSFNINLENNTFEQYESLLSNFKDWQSYKREIKLNSLLNDKKIEFNIVYKLMGVDENNMSDDLIDNISDAIEELVTSGRLQFDSDSNYLWR